MFQEERRVSEIFKCVNREARHWTSAHSRANTILQNRGDWPLKLRIPEWQQGGPWFFSEPLATEKQEIVIWNHSWVGKKILFPWKLDWRRRVVGYWLTKFSTLSLMKSKSAWTSTVPSPLLLYKECKICYPAQGQNSRCWQILQQVLEIHHITYLFFFPQATLTMSTVSCSIPWITLCQPGIEIITIQPLPLCSDQFYQENAQTNWRREKRAVLALQQWNSKEMREVRMLQTVWPSLRSPCGVHQWAQTIKTLPFLGRKHQQCPPKADPSLCAWCSRETSHSHCCWTNTTQSHTHLQVQLSQMELCALQR